MRCPCGSGLSVGNCQHYKEGDRVEAIKPPTGVEDSQADQIGLGEITAINLGEQNGETHKVMLDSGEEWWYSEDRLRLVTAAKPTPTPSITVGTQVRLTGVVVTDEPDIDGDYAVAVEGARKSYNKVWFNPTDFRNLEVIRQPFKRGEVVYFEDHGIACVVLEDEKNGRMLLIEASEGKYATYVDAANYQRRPSRPKEER